MYSSHSGGVAGGGGDELVVWRAGCLAGESVGHRPFHPPVAIGMGCAAKMRPVTWSL